MKSLWIMLVLFVIFGCDSKNKNSSHHAEQEVFCIGYDAFSTYSKHVEDTFDIRIYLPDQYENQDSLSVVYLLDGDFFSPMVSTALRQMHIAGKLPSTILVGIGYGSLAKMDSLRVRDYLYPKSIPSDEMEAPGGAMKFYHFLEEELVPRINACYKTDPLSNVISGHSFGGYFAIYSLLKLLENNSGPFRKIIAVSPTLWYNDFYLYQLFDKIKTNSQENIMFYTAVGGLENHQWSISPLGVFSDSLERYGGEGFKTKNVVFSELDHMDVAMAAFLKGLEFMIKDPRTED